MITENPELCMYRKKRDWLTIRESEAPGRGKLILPSETVHAILTTASLPLFRKNPSHTNR